MVVRILEDGSRTDNRIGAVHITMPPHTPGPEQHWHHVSSPLKPVIIPSASALATLVLFLPFFPTFSHLPLQRTSYTPCPETECSDNPLPDARRGLPHPQRYRALHDRQHHPRCPHRRLCRRSSLGSSHIQQRIGCRGNTALQLHACVLHQLLPANRSDGRKEWRAAEQGGFGGGNGEVCYIAGRHHGGEGDLNEKKGLCWGEGSIKSHYVEERR